MLQPLKLKKNKKNYNTHEAPEVTKNVLSPSVLLNEVGILIVSAT